MRLNTEMPSSYRLIFRVIFEHAFFADGVLRDLRIVPVPACHDMLRRAGVLLRPQVDGIAAFGDADVVQRLRLHIAETWMPLDMAFQVFVTDPHFFKYTAPGWLAGQLAFLDTGRCTTDAAGRQMLHASPCMPASALRDRAHADIVRVLGARVLPPTPAMVLQVAVSNRLLDTQVAEQRHYYVRFGAATAGGYLSTRVTPMRRVSAIPGPWEGLLQKVIH